MENLYELNKFSIQNSEKLHVHIFQRLVII